MKYTTLGKSFKNEASAIMFAKKNAKDYNCISILVTKSVEAHGFMRAITTEVVKEIIVLKDGRVLA